MDQLALIAATVGFQDHLVASDRGRERVSVPQVGAAAPDPPGGALDLEPEPRTLNHIAHDDDGGAAAVAVRICVYGSRTAGCCAGTGGVLSRVG